MSRPLLSASVKYCPLIIASINPNYTARCCVWLPWWRCQLYRVKESPNRLFPTAFNFEHQTLPELRAARTFLRKRSLKLVVVSLKWNYERYGVVLCYRLAISFTTLFWTLFGLITLVVLEIELRYVEGFGKVLFGLYNIAARILFLNMLIAMMSKSFNVTVVSRKHI